MAFTQVNDGRLVNSLWKDLWKARLLEWLKMFLWRIRANVIPTRVNLQQKMQHIDLACSFCNNGQWIVTLNMALILDEIWNSRNRKLFKQEQADLIKAKHRVQIRFLEISKVFAPTRPPPPQSRDHTLTTSHLLDQIKSKLMWMRL